MSSAYLWMKWVHILSATLLFGTGVGTAFHFWSTHLRGDPRAVAAAARSTVVADWLFVATSVVVQPASGLVMIRIAGLDYLASWLVATYVLYAIAVGCWLRVVALQHRVRVLAEEACASASPLPPEYFAAMRLWFLLGWPAFVSLLLIFWLMVMKPALW